MKKIILILSILLGLNVSAQLPDGSTAPNFTLIDIVDSNSYTLYDYLDAGKTVYIDIFAAHCPTCWSYHQTHTLKDLYDAYGPNGTDEVMVLALEYDQYNSYDAFIGVGPAWVTAGDWITGTPYPIFNVEDPDRTIFTDYQVPYYPLVYKICPDKKTEWISTSLNTSQLYQKVQDCQTLSIEEEILAGKIYIDQLNKNLIIENYDQVQSIEIINLQGQKINSIQSVTSGTIDIHTLETGIYIFQMNTEQGPVVRKLFMN